MFSGEVKPQRHTTSVYIRRRGDDTMLIVNNLSRSAQTIKLPLQYQRKYLDLFAGSEHIVNAELALDPYSYRWFQMQK